MDGWSAAQWVFNVIITLVLTYVARQSARIDRLSEELKRASEQRIQERFEGLTNTMSLHLKPLLDKIDDVNDRMRANDEEFKQLRRGDHDVEIKLLREVSQLKDVVATKQDLKQLREEIVRE